MSEDHISSRELSPEASVKELGEPYVPVVIHFEETDTLDFVERDVPTICRPVYAGLDVLLDMRTREPIGWRIYGWSRIAPDLILANTSPSQAIGEG